MSDETQEVKEESFTEKYDKLKAENDRMEANLKRIEELTTRKLLGGQTDNAIEPEKPREETAIEYRKRIMGY